MQIKKKQRDELQHEIRNLEESIKTEQRNRAEEHAALLARYKKRMEDLTREMEEKQVEGNSRMEQIEIARREMSHHYGEELERRRNDHHDELEKKSHD